MILPAVSLSIPRSPLVEALTLLKKTATQRRGEQAILSFDGKHMLIELGGGSVAVPATGECDLQIRVLGIMLLKLGTVMPAEDPLPLVLEDDTHFGIASIRLPCRPQPVGSKAVDLPVNAEKDYILQALSGLTPLQVEQSGLSSVHARAVALQRVTDAARILMPLGISEQDLLVFVEKHSTDPDILLP